MNAIDPGVRAKTIVSQASVFTPERRYGAIQNWLHGTREAADSLHGDREVIWDTRAERLRRLDELAGPRGGPRKSGRPPRNAYLEAENLIFEELTEPGEEPDDDLIEAALEQLWAGFVKDPVVRGRLEERWESAVRETSRPVRSA